MGAGESDKKFCTDVCKCIPNEMRSIHNRQGQNVADPETNLRERPT